jgi:hypothetical protein
MQEKYRQEHGIFEFYALALFARTMLRMAIFLAEPRRGGGRVSATAAR